MSTVQRRDHPAITASTSDQLFEDIARSAPTMLWVSDVNGAMIFQNQQYLDFTGLSEQAAKLPNSWSERVHPNDLDQAMSAYVNALKEHRRFTVEYRLRRHDGEYRNVLDSARPRTDHNGMFTGYVGSTMDITEQKAQEAAIVSSNLAAKKRSRDLNLLYELKSDLQVCREVAETRPVLTKYCEQLFPDTAARILLHNNSRDLVEPFLEWGPTNKFESEMFTPDNCWALRKGKNHLEHPTRLGAMCPNARSCNHHNYLCVPMIAFGETVGIMQLDIECHNNDNQPTTNPEQVEPLTKLSTMAADEIASAIEELKLRTRLEHQSTRDSLTHLFNRRYFMEALERELYRANQHQQELSLIMLDLDHFKQFNDTHGHIGGDMVLRAFGKVLEDTTRGGDVASRYGGEEFAVLMTQCPNDGARKRADEIRMKTEKIALEFHGELLEGITTSIGLASFPQDGDTIDELIANADKALYLAKTEGRNRVCDGKTIAATHSSAELGGENSKAVMAK